MIKLNSYTSRMINEEIKQCEEFTNKKLKLVKELDKPYYLIEIETDRILFSGTKKEIFTFLVGFNKIFMYLVK